jgi:WD40 repeat protein
VSSARFKPRTNPFVGPRPFLPGEPLFGRDREVSALRNLLVAERIVALYSPSGAGKTSLVQAGLVPKMQESDFHILPVIRVNQPPIAGNGSGANRYLESALRSLDEHLSGGQQRGAADLAGLRLGEYLAKRPKSADAPETDLLIFDQFEEILTLDPTDGDAKAEFFTQVGEALRVDDRWALFSFREDHLAGLEPFLPLIPTRLATSFRLEFLSREAAVLAIRGTAAAGGVEFTSDAAAQLVTDLSRVRVQQPDRSIEERPGPDIEPVQLQVVCHRLWNQLAEDQDQIDLALVTAQGDVSDALGGFYAESVATVAQETGVPERDLRAWFDEHLITKQGIRGQVLWESPRSTGLSDEAIRELINIHLVRAESRRGATWLELAHDRLIDPVRANNDAWYQVNLSTLQQQARLWQRQGRVPGFLLTGEALTQAEQWAADHPESLTAIDLAFLEDSQDQRTLQDAERRDLEAAQLLAQEAQARQQAEEAARHEAEQRVVEQAMAAKRLRRRFLVAVGLGLLAILAAIYAFYNVRVAVDAQGRAEAEAARAEYEARVGLSQQLAGQSRAHSDDLDLGLLLAAEAYDLNPDDFEVRRSLLAATHAQPRLEKVLHGHEGPIRSLAFSPDGKTLVSGDLDGMIRLWDPLTGEAAGQPITTGHRAVWDLAFRPDGRQFATADVDAIQLWDSATGAAVGSEIVPAKGIFGAEAEAVAVAFSPDGTLLASATTEGTIELWDPVTGRVRGPALKGHVGEVSFLAFSADGATLVSAGRDETVRFWDVEESRQHSEPLEPEQRGITGAAFTPDGSILATGGADGTIRLWDIARRVPIGEPLGEPLVGHEGGVAVAFSPDGAVLFSMADDGTIRQWEVATRQPLGEPIAAGQGATLTLAVSSDGAQLASGGSDGTIRLWDMAPERELFAPRSGASTAPNAIAYSPDGAMIATGHEGGEVLLWDAANGAQSDSPLRGHSETVSALAFSPDNTVLASASWDDTVRLWDLATRNARSVPLVGHADDVNAVAFSPNGAVLATGGDDGTVRLWGTSDWTLIGDPIQTREAVVSLRFSPDGTMLAAADTDGAVHLWNPELREPLLEEPIQTGQRIVHAVCFVRDGRELATAGDDGTIRYWDAANGATVGPEVAAHEGAVMQMVCNPDDSQLASSGNDGRVLLWSVGGGTPEAELIAVNDPEWREVAFSPDGSQIAFVSSAGTEQSSINLWDVDEERFSQAFPIQSVLTAAELSPDGTRLAAGQGDGHITIWEAETGTQIADQQIADEGGIGSVAFSPDGSRLAAGTGTGAVRLLDATAVRSVSSPVGYLTARVSELAFRNDGMVVASGDYAGTVQLWNTATHKPVGASFTYAIPPFDRPQPVHSLAFSPDGSVLAVSGWRTIGLWDVDRAAWRGSPLSGHSYDVLSLAFSPDGRLLASGGTDGVVHIWDIASGRSVAELPLSSTSAVQVLTFSRNGLLLAAGQWSGATTVWDLSRGPAAALGQVDPTDELVASMTFAADGRSLTTLNRGGVVSHWDLSEVSWRLRACTIANRNLTREEWATYIGDPDSRTLAFHAICPELPLPVETRMSTPVGEGAAGAVPAPLPISQESE